eukprot:jgi/Bigna1/128272/aug1.6_g2980
MQQLGTATVCFIFASLFVFEVISAAPRPRVRPSRPNLRTNGLRIPTNSKFVQPFCKPALSSRTAPKIIQQKQRRRLTSGDAVTCCARVEGENEEASPPFPVLRKIDGILYSGFMRYAQADLSATPLVLNGTTQCKLEGGRCILTSSVILPSGVERKISMSGVGNGESAPFRLDPPEGSNGPIHFIMSEIPPNTVLFREVNSTSGQVLIVGSISVSETGDEIVQVSHELNEVDSRIVPSNVQVWRMQKAN